MVSLLCLAELGACQGGFSLPPSLFRTLLHCFLLQRFLHSPIHQLPPFLPVPTLASLLTGELMSYGDLKELTKLPDEDLTRCLASLTLSKYKLLAKVRAVGCGVAGSGGGAAQLRTVWGCRQWVHWSHGRHGCGSTRAVH